MSELLLKYNKLDAFQKQELLDFLDFLLYKKRPISEQEAPIDEDKAEKRRQAAALLLEDYQQDEDLVAFTILDAEDFYEAK